MSWQLKAATGPAPSARANHTGTFFSSTNELFVYGGADSSGPVDDHVYAVNPDSGRWSQWAGNGVKLSGHTALFGSVVVSRMPEIYDLATNTWDHLTHAPLLQSSRLYPLDFVIPGGSTSGGRVITVGQADSSYWLDLHLAGHADSTGPWHLLPNSYVNFSPSTGVMYRPGRIMIAGGGRGGGTTGATMTLNTASTNNAWVASSTTDSLLPRINHNLVILPNGEVLALGGTSVPDNGDTLHPVRRPQIWNPDSANGIGKWRGAVLPDTLTQDPRIRGYHSSVILLPDGRALCAGGNNTLTATLGFAQKQANIFCPPYLFNSSGGLLTRAVIDSAPKRVNYGKVFTICTDSAATIKSACMIRPGAATHGFDQNQRFVPLPISKATSPSRLFATAPSSPDSAPPGAYLLFIVGSSGAPAVARWIYLDTAPGRDTCDAVVPATVSDLQACYDAPAHGSNGTIWVTWTAPADDALLAPSGAAGSYDLRKSGISINTESDFNAADTVPTTEPQAVGSMEQVQITGVPPGGTYYFRLKTQDDNVNRSPMSNLASIYCAPHTLCSDNGFYGGSGGGGGGDHAQRAAEGASARSSLATASGFVENSLLNGAGLGAKTSDLLRLAAPPVIENGTYQVRLRTSGTRTAAVDAVRLLVADHAVDAIAYGVAGRVVAGTVVPVARVTAEDGSDVTLKLDGTGSLSAMPGQSFTVELERGTGDSSTADAPLVIAASAGAGGGTPDSTGMLVQVPDGAGGWQTVRHVYPRLNPDAIALDSLGADTVRLLCLSRQDLRFVGRMALAGEAPTVQWAGLVSAQSSLPGDRKLALTDRDSLTDVMAGPDTLRLGFAVPKLSEGQSRDYFLAVDATLLSPRSSSALRSTPTQAALPVAFALRQNQPNPFAVSTTIRFELPVGAMVRLNVFDAQGRRVRDLAHRYFPAGYQSLPWDHRDGDGRSLGPGVYFYRMEAGPFRDRKKMVLIP